MDNDDTSYLNKIDAPKPASDHITNVAKTKPSKPNSSRLAGFPRAVTIKSGKAKKTMVSAVPIKSAETMLERGKTNASEAFFRGRGSST